MIKEKSFEGFKPADFAVVQLERAVSATSNNDSARFEVADKVIKASERGKKPVNLRARSTKFYESVRDLFSEGIPNVMPAKGYCVIMAPNAEGNGMYYKLAQID